MTWNIFYTGLKMPAYQNPDPEQFIVKHTPTIKIEYLFPKNVKDIKNNLNEIFYLVFLSQNGVTAFFNIVEKMNIQFSKLKIEMWAVGAQTATLAEKLFSSKVKTPEEQNAAGLIEAFCQIERQKVLLVTGENPRPEFITWLTENDWKLQHIKLYRQSILPNKTLKTDLKNKVNDNTVIFSAPSSVNGFLSSIGADNLNGMNCRFISFGSSTTNEILSKKGKIFWETDIPSAEYVINNTILKLMLLKAK